VFQEFLEDEVSSPSSSRSPSLPPFEVHHPLHHPFFPPLLLSQNPNHNYRDEVLKMLRKEEVRLIVNLDDLRDYNREYADG